MNSPEQCFIAIRAQARDSSLRFKRFVEIWRPRLDLFQNTISAIKCCSHTGKNSNAGSGCQRDLLGKS
jgi:hypothetical protein